MNKVHVPDWKLERYLLGELPSDELGAIAALERGDDELRGRIAALRADDDAILARYPPAWMVRKMRLASAGGTGVAGGSAATSGFARQRGRGGIPRWAIPVFACATLLLMLPLYTFWGAEPHNPELAGVYENRTKGGVVTSPMLEVWRKAGDVAEKLAPNAGVQDGDIVQLRYIVPKACYGALLSVDGRGVLTVHLSGANGNAARLTPGRLIALQEAYQLDDAPMYEAFYLITAAQNFDLESVKATLKDASHPVGEGQSLSLPRKQVTAFTLRKFDDNIIN